LLVALVALGLRWAPPGGVTGVLRGALWFGVPGGALGVGLGWLVALLAYLGGPRASRWSLRILEVLLAVPWVVLVGLLGRSLGGAAGFVAALTLIGAARCGWSFLEGMRALETEPFVEGARALGARRARLFLRQGAPWLRSQARRLGAEGAALAAPLDLLLSFVGAGSGLQDPLARAVLEGGGRAGLLLACAVAGAMGAWMLRWGAGR
jgi:ABC-type dipeptide/oligopeptide/nickel transport system permease subunit